MFQTLDYSSFIFKKCCKLQETFVVTTYFLPPKRRHWTGDDEMKYNVALWHVSSTQTFDFPPSSIVSF